MYLSEKMRTRVPGVGHTFGSVFIELRRMDNET